MYEELHLLDCVGVVVGELLVHVVVESINDLFVVGIDCGEYILLVSVLYSWVNNGWFSIVNTCGLLVFLIRVGFFYDGVQKYLLVLVLL